MKSKLPIVVFLIFTAPCYAHSPHRFSSDPAIDRNTRELVDESMALSDQLWDAQAHLIRQPLDHGEGHLGTYRVRESSWYAFGLLQRDAPGDRARAVAILNAVLAQQYTDPKVPWYGTFRRSPEEAQPGEHAQMWQDFDPNWREFIGTTFAQILLEFPGRISPQIAARLRSSIDTCIRGEIAEKRLLPSYSNVAVMYGFLWTFASGHGVHPEWQKPAADWTEQVYALFQQHDAFNEYNSPTYYGVDLYGLGLWRKYGSTLRMRTAGAAMEASLWSDVANLYQPELKNVSGPYDRSYGMDMSSYVTVLGVWMRMLLGIQSAPLPQIKLTTDHIADVWFAPMFAAVEVQIPKQALAKLTSFEGEHLVQKQINADRVATAWIGNEVIYGGESTKQTLGAGSKSQFHPATLQWRTPSGEIGWVKLIDSPPVDAVASPDGLAIATHGKITFRIHAKGLDRSSLTTDNWNLPGLHISVKSDQSSFSAIEHEAEEIDVMYGGVSQVEISVKKKVQDR